MNVTAIISEYNPLHKGHLYHIETAKKDTNADFIIGGDFRSGNSRSFKGRILELDLYSGILSAEKIQSLYENGKDAVTEGKINY